MENGNNIGGMKKERIRYDGKVPLYLTYIIYCELSAYFLIDLFLLRYKEAAIAIGGLMVLVSLNLLFYRLKWHNILRFNLMIVTFLQVSVTTYVLFEREAGFQLYYFIVIVIAYVLFDIGEKFERIVIVTSILVAAILFMFSYSFHFEFGHRVFSDIVTDMLFYVAAITSMLGVASLMWIFARDSYERRQALDLLANTDGLTSILNRRRFFGLAKGVFKEAMKNGEDIALLIFDIDYFKRINDVYGHPAGDEVLRSLAHEVGLSIRKNDLFARYGGEEFAVLLRGANIDQGMKVGEDIRKIVEDHSFKVGKGKTIRVTVSVGVSSIGHEHVEIESMIQAADKALYIAKESGRNRVDKG